jgi:hypothetical protein
MGKDQRHAFFNDFKRNQLFHAPPGNQITVISLIAYRDGIFFNFALAPNFYSIEKPVRSLELLADFAYSRGLAPLRNFSSISVRTGKNVVHTFQSSSEIVGYGMASLL